MKKGFTLIELLVVIAIIGILASVVLASLNTARGKGAAAAVKANLANIRAQAELVYDNSSNSYATVCDDANVTAATAAAGSATGQSGTCNDSATAWAAAAPLQSGAATPVWCVDSTGASEQRATALGADVAC